MAMQMDHPVRDSVVLITGGGRGVGELFARRLADEGAVVVLVARSGDELTEVADRIGKHEGKVVTFVADVTDVVAVRRIVDIVESETGPIAALINNAGIVGPVGNTWECEWKEWWRAVEINLGGTVAFSNAVVPRMAERGQGRIVNMVSEAGAYRWPTVSAYSVSKAAVIRFSENLALESSRLPLKVFAYHPGVLPLGMTTAAMAMQDSSKLAEAKMAAWCREKVESDKVASTDEAATTLVRLLSGAYDELSGRYITVHDDLDALLSRVRDKQAYNDYLMLRPQK